VKLTIEELRKVYDESYEGAIVAQESQSDAFDFAILTIYRLGFKDGAERQRAVEPTEEMVNNARINAKANCSSIYRAMSAVAPLVVPE